MKALQRLEKAGYQFSLTDGGIHFTYSGPAGNEPPDPAWSAPLFQEIKEHRQDVMHVLQARLDWLSIFEEWEQNQDPDADAAYVERLAQAAIAGRLPYYDIDENGESDAGPDGWRRLADDYKEVVRLERVETSDFVAHPLPWEQQ